MNRTVLVTGGNRGIGLAVAKGLAADDDTHVLMGCRDIAKGQEAAAGLSGPITPVRMRLADPDQRREDIASLVAQHPEITGLVNNAGVLHEGNAESTSIADIDNAWQVNTLAPIELIKAFLPGMKKRGVGRIVNVSSEWGAFSDGLTGPFSYSVTKAAINAVTMTVARELPSDITINSICPGWVNTRMGGATAPRTPEEGAATIIWLMNQPKGGPSGQFYRDKQPIAW